MNVNICAESVKVLVEERPEAISVLDTKLRLPLHYICKNPRVDEDVLTLLISAIVGLTPDQVRPAFMYSAVQHRTELRPGTRVVELSKPDWFVEAGRSNSAALFEPEQKRFDASNPSAVHG